MSNLRSIAERTVSRLLNEEPGDDPSDFTQDFTQNSPKGMGPIPPEHEPHILRAVKLFTNTGTYYLVLWRTGAIDDNGVPLLGYRFVMPDGTVLWQGTGYRPAMSHGDRLDGDGVLAQLISMITDNPDESGADEEDLTPQQLEFARSQEAMDLAASYGEWADHGDERRFDDLPGYET